MNVATDLTQLVSYARRCPCRTTTRLDGMHGANPLNLLIDVFIPALPQNSRAPDWDRRARSLGSPA